MPTMQEKINKILNTYQAKHNKVVILNLSLEKSLAHAAHNLFASLRAFDRDGADIIMVQGVEEAGLGAAIMNRLRKAASKIIE